MDIRDEIITGSFAIGKDGRKEPIDWKSYALALEENLIESFSKDDMINFAWFLKENIGQYNDDYIAHFEGKYLKMFKQQNK